LEKGFQVLECLKKSVLACANIHSRLRGESITIGGTKILERLHTIRRTPTAVKMAFVGGNACQSSMRAWTRSRTETYQGDNFSKGLREHMKDLHSWT
jgi:hypothetical protein